MRQPDKINPLTQNWSWHWGGSFPSLYLRITPFDASASMHKARLRWHKWETSLKSNWAILNYTMIKSMSLTYAWSLPRAVLGPPCLSGRRSGSILYPMRGQYEEIFSSSFLSYFQFCLYSPLAGPVSNLKGHCTLPRSDSRPATFVQLIYTWKHLFLLWKSPHLKAHLSGSEPQNEPHQAVFYC